MKNKYTAYTERYQALCMIYGVYAQNLTSRSIKLNKIIKTHIN